MNVTRYNMATRIRCGDVVEYYGVTGFGVNENKARRSAQNEADRQAKRLAYLLRSYVPATYQELTDEEFNDLPEGLKQQILNGWEIADPPRPELL